MGVPKFFRYISERYPCLSETIKDFQIPDFDNLYLDMNGIIHMCSHPDDSDPHFRITEEQIFKDIFHYIEVLFRMIRPRKLFFLAIDGVAPRAKMNQQRGRRFRSAKDAEVMEARAKAKGEELPTGARFDSNCITPGTVFMARLHKQLKYFIVNKISTDKMWQTCGKVILSGHETPGEGEHKIMDYIRFLRSQPGYDPNTRHCLYGLDADLMMLGLCTHEPHFSLLREEVKFGKKAKRTNVPEQITFFLLHLSLMREYLELEFSPIKNKLPFKYDIENIIDDWVLMGFLVGNDFIPHLPNLHIHNDALPILYNAYMKVLPTLDGYINENGKLNLLRFSKFMEELGQLDIDSFQENYADLKYFESKTGRKMDSEFTKPKPLEAFFDDEMTVLDNTSSSTTNDLADLIKSTEDMFSEEEDDNETETDSDECFESEFKQHKADYYMNKLDFAKVTPEVLRAQAEGYVRAIQWNLNYYYNGCCSWAWYYPHHYAPYISDIKDFKDLKIDFELGRPFYPFQQLLAVLPAASKELLPAVYHKLMTDESSSIIKYYPNDFETDLNGKRQEWEAVVLIPFIEEMELLRAMNPCDQKLTDEEKQRNSHGPMLVYEFSPESQGPYEAPQYFPRVSNNYTKLTLLTIDDLRVPENKLIKGAYPGVKFDVYFPGFPTFKHLKYSGSLEKKGVKVFDQPSRGDNMIVNIEKDSIDIDTESLAEKLLGRIVYVNWPHLTEAKVIMISDNKFRYELPNTAVTDKKINIVENKGDLFAMWKSSIKSSQERFMSRLGINTGHTDILIHVQLLIGRSYVYGHSGKFSLEKQWSSILSTYPYQTAVQDIAVHDPNFIQHKDVSQVYPIGGVCFMLGFPHYACKGAVIDNSEIGKTGRIKVTITAFPEPDFSPLEAMDKQLSTQYMTSYTAAQRLGINSFLFSRVTGCVFVVAGPRIFPAPDNMMNLDKINIGLNLKFNKKNEEYPGYTKKINNQWLYSGKVVDLVGEYITRCPELFDCLSKLPNRGGSDVVFEGDIFPDNIGEGKIKELAAWIKSQPYSSLDRQVCGSKVLDPDIVASLEKIIDEHTARTTKGQAVCMQVKSRLLFMPQLNMGNIAPDPKADYILYDRVINVREGYTVPVGAKGTVIGIHEPTNTNSATNTPDTVLYDVLFDDEFAGGLSLNCSKNRGYRLSACALLNISYGIRFKDRKKGDQKPNEIPTSWRKPSGNSAFAAWGSKNEPKKIAPKSVESKTLPTLPNCAGPPNKSMVKNENSKTSVNEFQAIWDELHDLGKKKSAAPPPTKVLQNNVETPENSNKPQVPVPEKINAPDLIQNHSETKSTEILKVMLKIEPQKETNSRKVSEAHSVSQSIHETYAKPIMLEDLFKQSARLETRSYAVELLHKFQMLGLGVPRYNYLQGADRTVRVQIFLPNGQNIIGAPALNKEKATELVAQLVLQDLSLLTPPTFDLMPKFNSGLPAPPQQWFQRSIPPIVPPYHQTSPRKTQNHQKQPRNFNEGVSPQQNNRKKHIENRGSIAAPPPKAIPNSKQPNCDILKDTATPITSFVPLQAIKKQRNRTLSSNTDPKTQSKDESNVGSMKSGNTQMQTTPQKPTTSDSKFKKKERKSRIAANFNVGKI